MHRHALVHLVTEFPETARDSLVITNPGQQIVVRRQHTPDPPVGAAATTGRPLAIASTTVSPKALPTTCLEKDIRIVKAVILLVAAHIRQPFDPESPIRAVGDGLRDSLAKTVLQRRSNPSRKHGLEGLPCSSPATSRSTAMASKRPSSSVPYDKNNTRRGASGSSANTSNLA